MKNRQKLNGLSPIQRLGLFIGLGIFALAVGLGGCLVYMDSIADVEVGPVLPIGKIINNGVELTGLGDSKYQGGDCQFVLVWIPYDGPLDDGPNGPHLRALKEDLYQKWKEYEQYMDARPYYPPVDQKKLSVWSHSEPSMKLNNYKSDGKVGLLRYWPRDLQAASQPLTVASWYTPSSNARRKADFLKAKERIEKQMAALKAHDVWDVWYLQGDTFHNYPVQEMYKDMGNFIGSGDIPDAQLYTDTEWTDYYEYNPAVPAMEPKIHNIGDLYTIFFGPIPRKGDYAEQETTSYYVFPVE
jgi:hypothetical protein